MDDCHFNNMTQLKKQFTMCIALNNRFLISIPLVVHTHIHKVTTKCNKFFDSPNLVCESFFSNLFLCSVRIFGNLCYLANSKKFNFGIKIL